MERERERVWRGGGNEGQKGRREGEGMKGRRGGEREKKMGPGFV